MHSLYNLLQKWPIKVMIVAVILLGGIAVFIPNIGLNTGNETLVDPETETYQINHEYQSTFGTDPIMIVFEGDSLEELLSFESLDAMHQLRLELDAVDGIFAIQSPSELIHAAAIRSEEQYQTALLELGSGLVTMSETIAAMEEPGYIDPTVLSISLGNLQTLQTNLQQSSTQEITQLEAMQFAVGSEIATLETEIAGLDPVLDADLISALEATVTVLEQLQTTYTNLITINQGAVQGTTQTAAALGEIQTTLSSLFTTVDTMTSNIAQLSVQLNTLGTTLLSLGEHFNMFEGAFPTEEVTLHMMVYPNGTLQPMLQSFVLDDTHLYMSIVLEEDTSNEELEGILHTIDDTLSGTMHQDALVSGKPVLDYDIQSSMMGSMQQMMMLAIVIMVVVLLVLFPVKARLLPLFIVLLAVVGTIGVMALFDIPLTMVSMAVFPVLIGLGIDYSIQFHNRYFEEEGVISNE